MNYWLGLIFLVIGIFQLVITWRTFAHLKKEGDKNTSPFTMLGLWNSLVFALLFIVVAFMCVSIDF